MRKVVVLHSFLNEETLRLSDSPMVTLVGKLWN